MADFSTLILDWYRLNKRNLPWRDSKSAYKVWISEIILQQTQVVQGLDYYNRFIVQFPTINELAKAEIDEVLNLWQGLGYYSRARNLHFAANQVMDQFNGKFPTNYNDIIKLKGVGEYTASAISSIIYNLPHAVVDGNVFRVLSRCFLISTPINTSLGKKEFTELANQLLDVNNPGDNNQGLMEIGALVCKPKNPKCEICPLQEKCFAFSGNSMLDYPIKLKKTKVKKRFLNYIIQTNGLSLLIKKRDSNDIWKGLYDFPLIESVDELQELDNANFDVKLKHLLTHQIIYASFWIKESKQILPIDKQLLIKIDELNDYPLPQLLVKYLKKSNYFNR